MEAEHAPPPERFAAPEVPAETPIDSWLETLGYIEPDGLKRSRTAMVDALADGSPEARAYLVQYRLLAEQLVDTKQGDEYTRAQIGLLLSLGLIERDAGRLGGYVRALEDALDYAANMGYDGVAKAIETELKKVTENQERVEYPQTSEAIAGVLRSLGFDEQTCAEIADMPFEEAFRAAYGYVLQADEDLDSDEILAPFMEDPKEE